MESLIDLDDAAAEIAHRVRPWAASGLAVGEITWRDHGEGWPPKLKTDRSTVIDADSVGVRLGFAKAEGSIVLFKGGWADFLFWSGSPSDEVIDDAPGYGAPMNVKQFGGQLDRLFHLFESTGNIDKGAADSDP